MRSLFCFLSLIFSQSICWAQTDSAQFFFQKGIEFKNARRYQQAADNFDKAAFFNKSFEDAILENALVHLEMRKIDGALKLFEKVHELNPANTQSLKELMTINYNYRRFEKAIEFAKKYNNGNESQRIIGMSLYHLEDYTAAETTLKSYLEKNVTDAEAAYTLARTYMEMEDYKKAVPFLDIAVKFPEAKAQWMYEQAMLLFDLRDYKNSLNSFLNAAEHGYIQSLDFKENLGYAYIYSGDFDNGEKMILSVWSKKTGNKQLLRELAEVLYQQKQYDRSLVHCQKLLEMDAGDSKALYQAGLCFLKKGDKSRGQSMCDKAIEMNPSLESLRRKVEQNLF